MINSFSQNKLLTALIEFNIRNKLDKTVHIQSSDLDQSELVVARYYSILSDDEKDRVNKNKFKLLRNRKIISRGLLAGIAC